MRDALEGLDAIDWHALQHCFGPADAVPALLRDAAGGSRDAWSELWYTIWHQGTVYEATPTTVPFLVRIAVGPQYSEPVRGQAAFLLASIASAYSFVLPEDPLQMIEASRLREHGAPEPIRDLANECNLAVAVHAAALVASLAESPPAVRAGVIASLAAIGPSLSTTDLLALREFEGVSDERIRAAIRLVNLLASGEVTADEVAGAARLDEEASSQLEFLGDVPDECRAVEVVRALCEAVASGARS